MEALTDAARRRPQDGERRARARARRARAAGRSARAARRQPHRHRRIRRSRSRRAAARARALPKERWTRTSDTLILHGRRDLQAEAALRRSARFRNRLSVFPDWCRDRRSARRPQDRRPQRCARRTDGPGPQAAEEADPAPKMTREAFERRVAEALADDSPPLPRRDDATSPSSSRTSRRTSCSTRWRSSRRIRCSASIRARR